ncbi:TonB-dependent receptor [Roseateles sp.]|uniref:TonB-dependent receptor n=1 Tax=Roseateles sp. TaxID=1971397 RepID=UPI0032631851
MFDKSLERSTAQAWRLRVSAVIALVLELGWGLAGAAEPNGAARFRVEQPARALPESLRAIAGQTGVSVLFDPAAVAGRMSKPVSGQLTAVQAITRALEGSGLQPIVMPDGSVVVRPAVAPRSIPASAPASSAAFVMPVGTAALVGSSPGEIQASAEPGSTAGSDSAQSVVDGATWLTRVEVTGSRLMRIDADGPTPVNVYTRADLERSGQPTLERFLSSLNEASISTGEGAMGQTTGQGAVQLRGLPLGSTLVLINGRRIQAVGSSSGNFFNLNLIPMAAIERIEIVPVGSSAVYGGDALAGVVNVILKKSLEGFAFDARVASARGTSDVGVSLAHGAQGEAGSFLLVGSYNKTTPLTMGERSYFADADYRRFGGTDARSRFCTPGTVTNSAIANLPGLDSRFAAVPATAPGQPLTPASFVATSGQANLCNSMANGHGNALVYGDENAALHAAGERRLGPNWSVFAEVTLARDRLLAEQAGILLNNVLVPATNPHNPFGVPVRVTGRLGLQNGAETFARDTDFKRILGGLRGEIAPGWEFEAALSTTRDDGERRTTNTSANVAARTAALAASAPGAALNPFTSGLAASEEVLRGIWSESTRYNHGRKDQASAFVRGSLLELPAGSLDLIAGAEWAQDRYQTVAPGSFDIQGSRTNGAVYSELRAPLWRIRSDAGRAWDAAAITLAARRDRYSDFGSASTYQAGLEVRPTRTTLLRASTATSFKPPTLLQTKVDAESLTTDDYGLVDPARGNEAISGGEVLRAANPALQPEKGRALSLGAVWEPDGLAGTRLAVTAWRVKIDGLISLLWPQVTLDNEALFPGFITRAPAVGGVPGQVTRVFYAEVNFGGLNTAGVDLEAAHTWKAAGARWNVAASVTRTTRYEVAVAPGAPVEDRLGRRAADYWSPTWKGRLSAGVDQGGWSLGLTSRYLGSYLDSAPSDRSLGGYWVHDLAASVDIKRLGLRLPAVKDARLALVVANLADRLPEFVGTSPYYDVTQADWRGRYASLRLSMTW